MIQAPAFLSQLPQNPQLAQWPTYLLQGEELLYQREVLDALWQQLQAQGVLSQERFEVDAQFDWQALHMELSAGNLFSDRRLIILQILKGNPGKAGTAFLLKWCQQAHQTPPEITLLIQTDKLDGRQLKSKWVQAVEHYGQVIQAKGVEARQLPQWCQQRGAQYGLQLDCEASEALAQRVEGNLLAADQELQKLALRFGQQGAIGLAEIEQSVVDQAHYQLFALSDELLLGRSQQALQILHRLQQEGMEAPVVLWLILKEIRLLMQLSTAPQGLAQAFKQLHIWPSKQVAYRQALQRHPSTLWPQLISQALVADMQIKGVKAGDPWQTLIQILLHITSEKTQ